MRRDNPLGHHLGRSRREKARAIRERLNVHLVKRDMALSLDTVERQFHKELQEQRKPGILARFLSFCARWFRRV